MTKQEDGKHQHAQPTAVEQLVHIITSAYVQARSKEHSDAVRKGIARAKARRQTAQTFATLETKKAVDD